MADVAERGARLDGLDAAPQRLERHLAQAPRLERRRAGEEHPAGVAVPAVQDHRDVDVQDVAVLQPPLSRNAVAYLMVDRDAGRLGIAPVVERGRCGAALQDEVVTAAVELARGDARPHVLGDHVEHLGGEPAGATHAGERLRAVDRNRGLGRLLLADAQLVRHRCSRS